MDAQQMSGELGAVLRSLPVQDAGGMIEFLRAEIECMQRESGCTCARSKTELNMKAIEWIEHNAHGFRERWNRDHTHHPS